MHVNQKPRRRHSDEFKAQVVSACHVPGASVSSVALSFGVNSNLVHQWRRGRGYSAKVHDTPAASEAPPQFVALPLPSAVLRAAAPKPVAAQETIRVEFKRGALTVSLTWPITESSVCTAWLQELLLR